MKNEKLTRKEIIDNRLKQAGWNVTDRTQVVEEFDIHVTILEDPVTPYAGHQYSDYVLLGKDGKPLAVVEAKKTAVDAALGREQEKPFFSVLAKRMQEGWKKFLYPEFKGELAKVLISEDPRVYGKGGLLEQFVKNDMPRGWHKCRYAGHRY